MKKRILSLIAITAIFATSCQDRSIFTEPADLPAVMVEAWADNFDDGDVSDWTMTDADADGHEWTPASGMLVSYSWNGGALTPDNWAVSPAIDLSGYGDTAVLSWEAMAADASWDDENYTVYAASTIAGLESGISFNEILDGVNELSARTMDISSLSGGTVYIGFRHHDVSDQYVMAIDNVVVTAEEL